MITRAFNMMATIVNPIVTALAGAGMIKALLVILTTTLGVLDAQSSTYKIFAAASNSVFYFLPIFLAFSSAKAFRCNSFIAVAIVAALLEPNFTGLMKKAGDVSSFLGIPVVLMGYTGTLIPAIATVYIYAKLETVLKRWIPKSIEIFALSCAALLVMVPLTMIVIGPIGVYLANGIGDFVNAMSLQAGLLTGMIVGAGWTLLVMMGIHWGVVPIMIGNIATYGYDFIRPMVAAATFASSGAALGVFLRSKNKETKAFALSAAIPALLGGVTEPIVYGISIKYKRPLIAQIIGGGIAGAFMGAMNTKAIVYVFPALTTLPAFFCDTFLYYIVGIAMAFFITAVLTYTFGIQESVIADETEALEPLRQPEHRAKVVGGYALQAYAEGQIMLLENVRDVAFASKALGEGIAIVPEKGELYAPTDGMVTTVFPTGHAVGITAADGREILLHIGINTVELNGVGFQPCVAQGEAVKQGQLLVKFDLASIQKAGYDVTTMMVVGNTNSQDIIPIQTRGKVKISDLILNVGGDSCEIA